MKISWMIFALMVLVQWAAPVLQIQRYENVIAAGELVKFKCNAPDPFDPLRGRYLVVSLADTHADLLKSESFSIGQTVYATLKVDADGFALFDTVHSSPPASGLYFKCKLPAYLYDRDARVRLEVPVQRYYLNEEVAPKADQWLADARQDRAKVTWVEVRLKDGLAVVTDIKHDGVSVNDVIRPRK